MANTVAIRRRIRSVSSTRQITKAMQLVAASKLRAATVAAASAQRYRAELDTVVSIALNDADAQGHPVLGGEANAKAPVRIVLIASDRGLAGAYHSRLETELKRIVKREEQAGYQIELTAVGQRAAAMALRLPRVDLIGRFPGPNVTPTMRDVRPAADRLMAQFAAGDMSRVIVITTRFNSTLSQEVEAIPVLPLAAGNVAPTASVAGSTSLFTLEPTPEAAITAAATAWLQAAMLDAAVSAVASEHAMRMVAMQGATDNAGDLIDSLTLQYNTARQSAITQELAEISGGVAALT